MAITTTFALNLVQFLDLTQGPTGTNADATSLSNGGLAVTGNHAGHTDLDIFNADASDGGGTNIITGTLAAVDQLANGNLAIVSQDADSILFTITDATGANVVASTDLADTSSTNADVAALTGGRFAIVNQDNFSATDNDIDVRIRNADGSFAFSGTVDSTGANDTNASVAGLDNGNFVVSWQRTLADASTEIWYAIYDANGAVVKAPAIADTAGAVNRNVSVTAINGGFAVVYEDNGWGTGTNDITLARFNSAGTFQRFDNISNPGFVADGSNDAAPEIARLSNGLLAITYSNNFNPDSDTIVKLFDPSTNTVVATRTITAGEGLGDDTDQPTLAGFGLGRIAVFHTNVTDGDADGEDLQAVRTQDSDSIGEFVNGDELVDIINGNGGADILYGGSNNDSLSGGAGNDTMFGSAGADTARGGGGNDTFYFIQGNVLAGEIIDGGTGADQIQILSSGGLTNAAITSIEEVDFAGAGSLGVSVKGAQIGGGALSGILTIDGRNGSTDKFNIYMQSDTAVNISGFTFIEWQSTGADADRVVFNGDGDAETIVGSTVRDDVFGAAGNDTINGHLGSDNITGGVGGDRFVFNTALGATNVDKVNGFEIDVDEFAIDNAIFTGLAAGGLAAGAFRIGANAGDAGDRIIYNSGTGRLYFDSDGNGALAKIHFATIATGLLLDNLDFVVI